MGSVEARLRRARGVAWRQDGLICAAQLNEYGLGDRKTLHRLVGRAALVPVHPGVWRIPDARENRRVALRAAVLWAGGEGVICGASAARLHGLEGLEDDGRVHLAVPESLSRAPAGVRVHRYALRPQAIESLDGIPVTRVERTLLDLAEWTESEWRLQSALESAWRRGLIAPARFLSRVMASPRRGKRGLDLIRRFLREGIRRRRPMESPLEVRIWRAMKEACLQLPEVQVVIRDDQARSMRADFLYRGERLIIEALGRESHGTREALDRDSIRTARITALGWAVLPVTWQMMEDDQPLVMRWIRDALIARRSAFALP